MIQQYEISIQTQGRQIHNITPDIKALLSKADISQGLCHVFLQHTSASLIVNENADPNVLHDLENFMQRLVQDGDPNFTHTLEGEDDMSAHIRNALTQTELSLPISRGELNLGTWQGIYLWEHRYKSYQRRLVITMIGA